MDTHGDLMCYSSGLETYSNTTKSKQVAIKRFGEKFLTPLSTNINIYKYSCPSVAEQWSAPLVLAGEPWQCFGVCTEFSPSTPHSGQSAGSAGPAEGLREDP